MEKVLNFYEKTKLWLLLNFNSFEVSYVTATFPYVILTALVIKGALLEGADKGVEFYVSKSFKI